MATLTRRDFDEILRGPPIYHLLGVCDKLSGTHFLSHAWKGLAGKPDSHEPGLPVVVKYLDKQVQVDIELACGLVSQVLMLPVPKPALVYADIEMLQDPPQAIQNGTILFGSRFQASDPFLVRQVTDDAHASEDIYNKVCATDVGPQGSAWDELVANPDRHPYNFLFDGRKWWLFDHNKALEPLNRILTEIYETSPADSTHEILTHAARLNLLYNEMLKRQLGVDKINERVELMRKRAKEIQVLADRMEQWDTDNTGANQIIRMAAVIVGIIGNRLSPLAELIKNREGTSLVRSLWTPLS